MNTNPTVRVLKQFRNGNHFFVVGETFVPNGVYRDHLLAGGFIEIVKAEDVQEAVSPAGEVQLPRRSKAKAKGATV